MLTPNIWQLASRNALCMALKVSISRLHTTPKAEENMSSRTEPLLHSSLRRTSFSSSFLMVQSVNGLPTRSSVTGDEGLERIIIGS